MKRLPKLLTVLLMLNLFACSSNPSKPDFSISKVIERIGNKSETPSWATGELALFRESNDLIFVNVVTMSGDARPESCVRASEETSRAQMLRYIKDQLTTSGQVNELNSSNDPGVETLTAFLSQGKLSGASIAARYWERVEESDVNGERVLRIKCAAKVAINKTTLERQLREAANSGEGNPEIRKKLISAQEEFIESVSKSDIGKRSNASTSSNSQD